MLNGFKSAFLVLVRPKQIFSSIGEAPAALWVPAVILVTLVMVIKPLATAPAMQAQSEKIIMAQVKRMEAEQAKAGDRVPPEVVAQMKRDMKQGGASGMLIFGAITQAVAVLPGVLLSALALLGLGKLFRININFKVGLVLIGLSFMPYFVGEVIKTFGAMVSGSIPTGQGMSSLVMPQDPGATPMMTGNIGSTLAFMTLSRIDVFVLWSLILLAIGVHNVAGQTRARSAAIAASYWLVAWLVVVLPAAATTALLSGVTSTVSQTGP